MRLKSLSALSCAAASGVFAGTLIERRRNGSPAADLEPARKMPGLPVFGTVSAATPFSGPQGGGAVVPAPVSPLKGCSTLLSCSCPSSFQRSVILCKRVERMGHLLRYESCVAGAQFNWEKIITKIIMKILKKVQFEKEICTNYFF